jgi:imidazolonepropionase-like amidohydrolase
VAEDTKVMIRGGIVLKGTKLEPVKGEAVVIDGERIVKVGPEKAIAKGKHWRVVDAEGHTVMPGLMDAHVHFFGSRSADPMMWQIEPAMLNAARAVADARKLLDHGFTTVRDLGSRNGVAIKRAVDERTILGPRTVPAHFGLSMTCGHGDVHNLPSSWICGCSSMAFIVDGSDNVRKAVRQSVRDGADVIKIWTSGGTMSERDSLEDQHFSDEEIQTAVSEAHALRRKIASHAEGLLGARASIKAGVDSIEHGFVLDEACCADMKKKGTFLVPTLALLDRVVHAPGVPEYARAKARPMFDAHLKSFQLAVKMGVKIGSGCDAFSDAMTAFGPYNLHEIELMVDGGLKPLEALRAATSSNAELLGIDKDVGAIDAGKIADVLVVDGDLTKSVKPLMNADNLTAILQGGMQLPRLKQLQPFLPLES